MKKMLALLLTAVLALGMTACGAQTSGTSDSGKIELVEKTLGDITMKLPTSFGAVEEKEGMYVCAGNNASVVVSGATEIDVFPDEWDEETAASSLEVLYSATYTDMQLVAFEAQVDSNGSLASYMAFTGYNSSGVQRLVQITIVYDDALENQYLVTFMHSVDDQAYTEEIGTQIMNSITLN